MIHPRFGVSHVLNPATPANRVLEILFISTSSMSLSSSLPCKSSNETFQVAQNEPMCQLCAYKLQTENVKINYNTRSSATIPPLAMTWPDTWTESHYQTQLSYIIEVRVTGGTLTSPATYILRRTNHPTEFRHVWTGHTTNDRRGVLHTHHRTIWIPSSKYNSCLYFTTRKNNPSQFTAVACLEK